MQCSREYRRLLNLGASNPPVQSPNRCAKRGHGYEYVRAVSNVSSDMSIPTQQHGETHYKLMLQYAYIVFHPRQVARKSRSSCSILYAVWVQLRTNYRMPHICCCSRNQQSDFRYWSPYNGIAYTCVLLHEFAGAWYHDLETHHSPDSPSSPGWLPPFPRPPRRPNSPNSTAVESERMSDCV